MKIQGYSTVHDLHSILRAAYDAGQHVKLAGNNSVAIYDKPTSALGRLVYWLRDITGKNKRDHEQVVAVFQHLVDLEPDTSIESGLLTKPALPKLRERSASLSSSNSPKSSDAELKAAYSLDGLEVLGKNPVSKQSAQLPSSRERSKSLSSLGDSSPVQTHLKAAYSLDGLEVLGKRELIELSQEDASNLLHIYRSASQEVLAEREKELPALRSARSLESLKPDEVLEPLIFDNSPELQALEKRSEFLHQIDALENRIELLPRFAHVKAYVDHEGLPVPPHYDQVTQSDLEDQLANLYAKLESPSYKTARRYIELTSQEVDKTLPENQSTSELKQSHYLLKQAYLNLADKLEELEFLLLEARNEQLKDGIKTYGRDPGELPKVPQRDYTLKIAELQDQIHDLQELRDSTKDRLRILKAAYVQKNTISENNKNSATQAVSPENAVAPGKTISAAKLKERGVRHADRFIDAFIKLYDSRYPQAKLDERFLRIQAGIAGRAHTLLDELGKLSPTLNRSEYLTKKSEFETCRHYASTVTQKTIPLPPDVI